MSSHPTSSHPTSSHPIFDPASGRHPGAPSPPRRPGLQGDAGQATAEYALVMLAAAALAGLLLAWAASTDGISRLLDHVINSIINNAG